MSNSKSAQSDLDFGALVEGLGQGILLFDGDDRLVLDNQAARAILGANFALVNSEGWSACAMLLDSRKLSGASATEIRSQALQQDEPVRFHTLLAGAYTPCWATGVNSTNGTVYTMITLDQPDWTALNELMSTFRDEAKIAISSTAGHAELIRQLVVNRPPGTTADQIAERVVGFAGIMATHMYRLQILMELLERLEIIRTGQLAVNLRQDRRKISLADFIEDFMEELGDQSLTDPAVKQDLRDRLTLEIPDNIKLDVSPACFKEILRDLLRNAVLYSPADAPIALRATYAAPSSTAQIDVIDQGYGIRAKEAERIFAPFQRARQPQVIAEFGYGLSLYLAKAEVEAMGGRIWYESEEGVGSTFSLKLPIWRDNAAKK